MRGIVQSEAVTVAEAAVEFNARDEILGAETTALDRGFQSQRAAGPDRVAELPGRVGKILSSEGILRDIPSFERLGKQELEFQFVFVLLARQSVGTDGVGFAIVAFDLLQDLVRAADVL